MEGLVEMFLSGIITFELVPKFRSVFSNIHDAVTFSIGIGFLVWIAFLPLMIACIITKK